VFHVKQREALPDARIEAFIDLLLRWNGRINLVAERDPEAIRARHVADSLQLLPHLPEGDGPLGDLGSGGGFPGLILALASGRPAHLVESDRRKAAFLIEAAARLDLPRVKVHATRIEAASLPPLEVLTARALAPLTELLPHAVRFLGPAGIALFPKGRTAAAEVKAAHEAGWAFTLDSIPSQTDPSATILRLSDIRRAAPQE
jgi:16S rRNA (guanine527-N7)-methyltransferase